MLSRNDQPNIYNFNFGVDSVFNNVQEMPTTSLPPMNNFFLLLDGTNFHLLDGENLLLLG